MVGSSPLHLNKQTSVAMAGSLQACLTLGIIVAPGRGHQHPHSAGAHAAGGAGPIVRTPFTTSRRFGVASSFLLIFEPGQPLDYRTGTCATRILAPGQQMTEAELRPLQPVYPYLPDARYPYLSDARYLLFQSARGREQ